MRKVVSTEKKPIKLWLDDIEDGALEQAKNLANLPFIFKHVAIMPDSHRGYGMPIGGILATTDAVIPNAVGVDIGCGMCAVKTSIPDDIDQETLKKIMGGSKEYHGGIRSRVPVGFKHHSKKQDEHHMPDPCTLQSTYTASAEYENARKQIGTLGGGNHFIEIQKGSDGAIWLMIHSGSRNLGYKVAKHYNTLAKELNAKWFSSVPEKWGLAFLPGASAEYHDYLEEMTYCVNFARANRLLMLERVMDAIHAILPNTSYAEEIDVCHNFAALECHFNKNVMVHRKGATMARDGEYGIIPGSQGSKSYIVQGLGNPASFQSCSHGAGRKMGRKQAIKTLDFNAEKKLLDGLGVVHNLRNASTLDEAPGAYKDISVVMANQEDLAKPFVELTPLAVIKG